MLLSDATERLLPGMIKGIGVQDLGEHGLKDLSAIQHLYQLVIEGLRRDGSERQRTLRNAIAWSHDLLSDEEKILFRKPGYLGTR